MAKPVFATEYLNNYLAMVEDTESPRLYHVWAAVSAMAATLGRRCWLPFGTSETYANHYVLLIGEPGTRKSTALNIASRIVRNSTGVKFGPTDTGGHRQGLIEALITNTHGKRTVETFDEKEKDEGEKKMDFDPSVFSLASLANLDQDEVRLPESSSNDHHLYEVVSEFTGLLGGVTSQSMLQFLTQMWDGDYDTYRTKSGIIELKTPLMNLLGCTTPTSLASAIPAAISGQGLLSRCILVHGARKYKSVPRPPVPDKALVHAVSESINRAYRELEGAFSETKEAADYADSLYEIDLGITDARLSNYIERRHTHLRKLAMVLAASRGEPILIKQDYYEAHRILKATERGMPDALGEFGLSKLAALKQRVIEYVRLVMVIPMSQLQAAFHRDATAKEIVEVIHDLVRAGQLILRKAGDDITIHSVRKKEDSEDVIMAMLAEG